jgi:transcriptional regulator of acetoin/glycerol metabolism
MPRNDLLNGWGRAVGPSRVLIVGPEKLVDEWMNGFVHSAPSPIYQCTLPGALALPQAASGTLILRDVARLTESQQQVLRAWLDDHPHVRVISVSLNALYDQVRQGQFDEPLYYRLNVVLEVLPAPSLPTEAARAGH